MATTEKELHRLTRGELLEIILDQRQELERIRSELEEAKAQLKDRDIRIRQAGSIAEASLALTNIFSEAQKAADLYLENVRRQAGNTAFSQNANDNGEEPVFLQAGDERLVP